MCYTFLSQVQITLSIYIFKFLKDTFVVLQPYIFLGVFNILVIMGVLRYGLGQKQPKLVILTT